MDLDLQPLGQGVDHGSTYAVEAAGHFISPAPEFSAGMEHGKNNLQGGFAGLLLGVHRDAAAIIGNADDIAFLDADLDMAAIARQSLINGVIHNFIDQVMKTGG